MGTCSSHSISAATRNTAGFRIQTSDKNFNAHVRIENQRTTPTTGRFARADGYVLRYHAKRSARRWASPSIIRFSTRRYVARNAHWTCERRQSLDPVRPRREAGARKTEASLTPAVAEDPKEHTTTITADVGYSGLPYDQVDLAIALGSFSRSVGVRNQR